MNFIRNLLFKKGMQIQFNEALDAYTVVRENASILFVGTKAKCRAFLKSHMA